MRRATSWDWRRSTRNCGFSTIQSGPPRSICRAASRLNQASIASQPQIEFVGVSKRYANTGMALQGIDLAVLKGEFVSLIGPSGCGKSTVLKLISGLTAPSAGAIQVDGMEPQDARETVSYIFQDATLLPWRPVEDNVGLGLELEGASKARRLEKTDALLKLVGLGARSAKRIRGNFRAG